MLDAGSSVVTLEEIQQQAVESISPLIARRRPWGIATAIFLLVVVGGVLFNIMSRPSTFAPSSTEPAAALSGPVLPPVQLGFDQLWPPRPTGSSVEVLAQQFAVDVLEWDSTAITEFELDPEETPRVHIHQQGVEELVDAIFSSKNSGTVITEVGPPWFMGVQVSPLDPDGTRIHLLRIGDDVNSEVTVLLSDGAYVVVSKTIDLGVIDSTFVDLPDVPPEEVRSVLIRYVDEDGKVIAANGAGALSVSSAD